MKSLKLCTWASDQCIMQYLSLISFYLINWNWEVSKWNKIKSCCKVLLAYLSLQKIMKWTPQFLLHENFWDSFQDTSHLRGSSKGTHTFINTGSMQCMGNNSKCKKNSMQKRMSFVSKNRKFWIPSVLKWTLSLYSMIS